MTVSQSKKIVDIFSVLIPLVVALLIGIPVKFDFGSWTKVLPDIIGIINSTTSIVLLLALLAIKFKKITMHKNMMYFSVFLGLMFLVLYVLYHVSNPSTPYGGVGFIRYIYYFLLITHIVFSIGVVRFVLLALHYAVHQDFQAHKKVVKYAYPIWLYVSVTGVLVYWMIKPYYV